jgi:hypothetical protein
VFENLQQLENYIPNAIRIERERARLRDRENRLREAAGLLGLPENEQVNAATAERENYERDNLPQELIRGEVLIPNVNPSTEVRRTNFSEAETIYRNNIGQWLDAAREQQQIALDQLREEAKPPEVKVAEKEAQAQKERADRAEAAQKAAQEDAQRLREQHMQEMQAKNDQIAGLQQKIDEATAETARARKFENPPRTEEEWAEMPAWIKEIYERDAQQRARIIELEDQIEATQRPSLADRLRTIGGLMFGAGTTEAAALAVLAARPELGPVSYLLGSMTATSAWMLAEVGSMRRGLEVEHPRLARFIRDSMNGSILTTIANTAVSALEATGVTHLLHNAPETAQQAAQTYTTQGPQWTAEFAHTAAREAGKATAPIKTAVETLHTVASGENLSTIVRDTLHLTNYQEIYRHTVETILGNLDKLPADKASLISNLTTEQVMKDQELFKKVMDAGRIIHPGQTFAIK